MTSDKGGALPKFGAWDEQDPSSGDSFTTIFNNARKEKLGGPARLQAKSPAKMQQGDAPNETGKAEPQKKFSIWGCCFGSSDAA